MLRSRLVRGAVTLLGAVAVTSAVSVGIVAASQAATQNEVSYSRSQYGNGLGVGHAPDLSFTARLSAKANGL